MRLDFLPPEHLARIAWALVDTHGGASLDVADRTIEGLVADGEDVVAEAWRCVRSMLEDALSGRLGRDAPTIH